MTDEERKEEGAEEAVEDLEAPAEEQEDVAGGRCGNRATLQCMPPTQAACELPSCLDTKVGCEVRTKGPVVYNE